MNTATTADDLRRRLEQIAARIDTLPRACHLHFEMLIEAMSKLLDEMTGHAD